MAIPVPPAPRACARGQYPGLVYSALSTAGTNGPRATARRSEEHTSELQSPYDLVCRLLLEKKKRDSRSSLTPAFRRSTSTGELHVTSFPLHFFTTVESLCVQLFFITDTPTTELYTLSLHDALPISWRSPSPRHPGLAPGVSTRG